MTHSARKIPYQLFAVPALSLLAACATTGGGGGGGGGTPPPPPAAGPVYADDAGTMHATLEDGATLHAYNSAMSTHIVQDWTADERRLDAESVDFSIADNGDGTYSVTVDGQTTVFTPDLVEEGFRYQDPVTGQQRDVWLNSDDFLAFVEGYGHRHYHSIWNYWWDTGENLGLAGHAVVGTETTPEYVDAQDATATYSGYAEARFLYEDETNDDRYSIGGDLELTANFSANEISGSVDNLEREDRIGGTWSAPVGIAGTIDFESGTIAGNQFSGNLAGTGLPAGHSGTYEGKFFGPKANEVGGVISATGPGVVGTGFFSADRE